MSATLVTEHDGIALIGRSAWRNWKGARKKGEGPRCNYLSLESTEVEPKSAVRTYLYHLALTNTKRVQLD
jgi:hypothetical protein